MKIDSLKMKEAIMKASNVLIMAHSNLDLDAFGACLGLFYVSSSLDKSTYILIEDGELEQGVNRAIKKIKDLEYKIDIVKYKDISKLIDNKTLLIIPDTNNVDRLQSKEAFNKMKNKIIIDHHIKNYNIDDLLYEYINDRESSTCEIIIDLINDLNVYIPEYIATVMLSGIYIDTNNFNLRVSKYTFEVANKLMNIEANVGEIQYLLKQDFIKYVERQKIIFNTEFINTDVAISVADDTKLYAHEELAKSADTILLFNNVECSFVIGKTDKDLISISARSIGKYDVQQIMKHLNGGGHKTEAATQIKNKTSKEVKEMLLEAINNM